MQLLRSTKLKRIESTVMRLSSRYSILILRLSLGIIFLLFGLLKFIPGASPAEELALRTIELLTGGVLSESLSRVLLASLESMIGLGFLIGRQLRLILIAFLCQMVGTLAPLVLFPNEMFRQDPLSLSLEGQYILKNLVLIGAAIVIWARSSSPASRDADTNSNHKRGWA